MMARSRTKAIASPVPPTIPDTTTSAARRLVPTRTGAAGSITRLAETTAAERTVVSWTESCNPPICPLTAARSATRSLSLPALPVPPARVN